MISITHEAVRSGDYTTQSVSAPPAGEVTTKSEFCRLPKPRGRCSLTGLSRTTICELIASGKVKSVKLRKPGAARGIVLVHVKSLLDYLHAEAEGGAV